MSQDIEMTTIESNDSTLEQFYDMLGDSSSRTELVNPSQLPQRQPSTACYAPMPASPASTSSDHSSGTISLFSPTIYYHSTYPVYQLGSGDHGDYVTFILTVSPLAIESAMEYLLETPGVIGGIAYDDINYEGGNVPIIIELRDDEDTLDDGIDYIQNTPLVEMMAAVPARWDCTDIHWVCTTIVCTQMLSYARLYLDSVPGGYAGISEETWKIPTGRQGETVKILTKIHPWMLGRAWDYCMTVPGRIAVIFRLEV